MLFNYKARFTLHRVPRYIQYFNIHVSKHELPIWLYYTLNIILNSTQHGIWLEPDNFILVFQTTAVVVVRRRDVADGGYLK